MPIPTSTAQAAMSIVGGLVRLAGRVDNVMAEQAALREELALPGRALVLPPLAIEMTRALQALLDETAGAEPDPIGARRVELTALLAQPNPAENALLAWMEELLPDRVAYRVDDPAGEFAARLAARRGAWDLDDDEIRRLAYHLDPGRDLREATLPWQLATTVVGVLSEVALENQALVLRDDRARPVVVAVLARFAEPDIATVGSHRTLLRFVLKTTLNGALDAGPALAGDKAWVEAVLTALAEARAGSDRGDDYVVGLVRGRGYPRLVGSLLDAGADRLAAPDAERFAAVAADVLGRAGTLVGERPELDGFVRDHWGDLLRAGLQSVHANGHAILADDDPLLRRALLAALASLADVADRDFLTGETLAAVVEAAVGAIAVEPALLDDAVREDWLREVLASTAGVVADAGVRRAFSAAGLQRLVQDLAAGFARRPALLIARPGLARDLAGAMLGALAAAERPGLETVAAAGVEAALAALAANPGLVDTDYPALVAGLAGVLAARVDDLRLSRAEAGEILREVAAGIAADPGLLGLAPTDLPAKVLAAVLGKAAEHRGSLVGGAAVRELAVAALAVVAADPRLLAGRPELLREAIAPLLVELAQVADAGDGGRDLRLSGLARAGLGGLLGALARDPALLDTRYASAVARVARELAERLVPAPPRQPARPAGTQPDAQPADPRSEARLTVAEASQVVDRAARAIARNPALLANQEQALAARVLGPVIDRVLASEALRLRGAALVELADRVLGVLAAHGRGLLGDDPVDRLVERLLVVVVAGLDQARAELGRKVDSGEVPEVIGRLLRRWATDRLETLEIDDPRFAQVFEEIVDEVAGHVG